MGAVGEILAGRYELVDPLGEGGTGVVWRAWDHRERRYVAAKVMRQSDAGSLLRFVREQAVRIDHRHVLTPHGWAGEDDRVLLTMPVVRGGSAATLVGDHGALPPVWAATLLDQLLAALESIHAEGLVHRDVKPANLLLDATGRGMPRVRLADFGIAAAVDQPRLTHVTHSVGTLGYAAPETLEAGWDPDPRADLYGAGLTAVELLTAERPTAQTDVAAVLDQVRVPSPFADLVLRLASPLPDDRPASATEARAQLAATGLVARSAQELGDLGVEVFDQLPPLPEGWGEDGPAAPAVGDVAGAPAVASPDVPGAPAVPHLPRATGRPTGSREVTGEPTRTDLGPPTQEVPRPRVEATATHRVEQPHTRADGGEQDPDAPATADVATQPPGTGQARPQLRTGLALVVLGLLMMLASLLLVLV
ncbi:hypothetical protein GCM10009584_23520 [Ornithinimicrobium humiphilum]